MDLKNKKCGYIAIAGCPNAGKSTLINKLVGHKVSITSSKVQTTRFSVLGICLHHDSQIIFVDTAGLFQPQDKVQKTMVDEAWNRIFDADCILYLIDASNIKKHNKIKLNENIQAHLTKLQKSSIPVFIGLNKVDLMKKKSDILPIISEINQYIQDKEIFLISALSGDGIEKMKDTLSNTLPVSPWLYAPQDLTNLSPQLYAEELTREKIFHRFHKEIPYDILIKTDKWEKNKKNELIIHQTIFTLRDSQKKILLGQKGEILKQIGIQLKKELSQTLKTIIHLYLFVKSDKDIAKKIQHTIIES